MTDPVRLQLSRRRGFNLQEHSQAVNGLPAVNVARPTKWGNPFRIGDDVPGMPGEPADATDVIHYFRLFTVPKLKIAELRGKNLACWCKPGAPCHADVLLELANAPTCEEVTPQGSDRSPAAVRRPVRSEAEGDSVRTME